MSRGKRGVIRCIQSCGKIGKSSQIMRIATFVANGISVSIYAEAEVDDQIGGCPPLILPINSHVIRREVNVAQCRKTLEKTGAATRPGQRPASLIRDAAKRIITAVRGSQQTDVGENNPFEVESKFDAVIPFQPGNVVDRLILSRICPAGEIDPRSSQRCRCSKKCR